MCSGSDLVGLVDVVEPWKRVLRTSGETEASPS